MTPTARPADAPSPTTPEPPPIPNDRPAIWDLVIEDMRARDAAGLAKYGTRLQAGNGRDPLIDRYQEQLDGVAYTRQEIEERRLAREALRAAEANDAKPFGERPPIDISLTTAACAGGLHRRCESRECPCSCHPARPVAVSIDPEDVIGVGTVRRIRSDLIEGATTIEMWVEHHHQDGTPEIGEGLRLVRVRP